MGSSADTFDVVVVGAGVIGCGIAQRLAEDFTVAVFDKGQIAGGASGLSAGLIAPTLFYPDLPRVASHANEFFREYDDTGQFRFTARRRIELITEAEKDRARGLADLIQQNGLPASFLEPDEVNAKYPWFQLDQFVGGLEIADAGWIDPFTYTVTLKEEAERNGAMFESNTTVEEIVVEDGEITGVKTESGQIAASTVVLAAGWQTKALVEDLFPLPIQPYRLECVTLSPVDELAEDFPLARIPQEELYLRPEHNGDLLIGGGERIEPNPEEVSHDTHESEGFRNQVARVIPDLISGFERAEFVDGWVGVDSCTPDGRPIIDEPDSGPAGLVIATGFNGLGMVNSPIAPTVVRSILTGEDCPFPTEPFSYERLDSVSADFDLQSNSNFDIIETALGD